MNREEMERYTRMDEDLQVQKERYMEFKENYEDMWFRDLQREEKLDRRVRNEQR